MTKKELQQLQKEIHQKEDGLNKLQMLHVKETGRRYIVFGPLPPVGKIRRNIMTFHEVLKKEPLNPATKSIDKIHLCNRCRNDVAICDGTPDFGCDNGGAPSDDNVVRCDKYINNRLSDTFY